MKYGIIGIGKMGTLHLKTLLKISCIREVYVYDISKEAIERAEGIGGVPVPSIEEIVEKSDLISICTPTSTHYKVLMEILNLMKEKERRVEILVEKPLASNYNEGLELLKEILRTQDMIGRFTVGVAHIERFNPVYKFIKGFVEEYLEDIEYISIRRESCSKNRNRDVSVVYDLMVHDIDMLLRIFGREPKIVRVSGGYDNASVMMMFGDVIVKLEANRDSSEKRRKVMIHFKDGVLLADLRGLSLGLYKMEGNELLRDYSISYKNFDPLREELETFVKYTKDFPVKVEEAVESLRVCDNIMKKLRSQSPSLDQMEILLQQ